MSGQISLFGAADAMSSKMLAQVEEIVGEKFHVNRFVENFAVLVDAAGGMASFRRLVLQLGVRGRLVTPSDRDDSSAAILAGIEAKRVRLVAARRASRADDLPPVTDDDAPFSIPPSWSWVRFGRATICRDGQRIPVSKEERAGRRGQYDYYGASGVIDKIDKYIFDEPLLLIGEDGANLLSRSTPIAFIASGQYWVNNHAHVLDSLSLDMLRFLAVFVNAIDLAPYVTGTAQPKMNQAKMNSIPVAIPPLAEQTRIVAKVDQLMALCDDLEAKQTRKRELGTRLTKSALEALSTAEGPEEFDTAWKRVIDNFDTLIDRSDKVADLRRSVLALAASGKLCSHSPEPPPSVPRANAYEAEFTCPSGWAWSSLGALCKFIDYRGRTPAKTSKGVRLITAKNVRMGVLREEPREYIAESDYEKWMTRGLPRLGDVLFTTEAPLGNVAQLLTTEKVALAQRIITLQPLPVVQPSFLMTVLMSPQLQASIADKATGMTALGIKAAKLKLIPFPVPTLDEQTRIVQRVGELMALCDDLEARLRQAEDRASKFAEAVVQELVA